MCHPIFKMPSFYAHVLNGLFLLIAIILVVMNMNELKRLKLSKLIHLVVLFSIGFGVHSLSHLGLERVYGFNPINDVTV
jgi:hypothetical protein